MSDEPRELLVEHAGEPARLVLIREFARLRLECIRPDHKGRTRVVFDNPLSSSPMRLVNDTLKWMGWQWRIAEAVESREEATHFANAVNAVAELRRRFTARNHAMGVAQVVEALGWISGVFAIVGGCLIALDSNPELGIAVAFGGAVHSSLIVLAAAYVKVRLEPQHVAQ